MTTAAVQVTDQVGARPNLEAGRAIQYLMPPPLVNEDIVRLVLEYYFDSCEEQPSRDGYHRDLVSFSCISRVWRRPAQELLSFHVSFSQYSLYEQFLYSNPRVRYQLARSTPHSNLYTYIRIFEINIGKDKKRFKCSQLPMILRGLPNLFELRLKFEDLEPNNLSNKVVRELSSLPRPPRALRLIVPQLCGFSEVVPQILELPWPIQYLEISESCREPSQWVTWVLLWRIRPKPTFQLEEFRWRVFIQDCEENLLWLLQASITAGSLRSLHIPCSLRRFDLEHIAPNVTSVHISVHTRFDFYPRRCSRDIPRYIVFVPRALPVQEMRISGSLGWPHAYLGKQLPPTVTKLQLDSSNSMQEAANIVGILATLPEDLRELILVGREDVVGGGEAGQIEEEYVRAMSECRRQGVELMRRPEWLINNPHFAPVARPTTVPLRV